MYYLTFLGISFVVSYIVLFFLFSYFFENTTARMSRQSLYSILSIAVFAAVAFTMSFLIPPNTGLVLCK